MKYKSSTEIQMNSFKITLHKSISNSKKNIKKVIKLLRVLSIKNIDKNFLE